MKRSLSNQTEDLINSIDTKITSYLMSVSKENLNDRDMQDFNLHLQVIKNLERIGDLSVNLVEFFDMVHEDKNDFSDGAKKDVLEMFELFKPYAEHGDWDLPRRGLRSILRPDGR